MPSTNHRSVTSSEAPLDATSRRTRIYLFVYLRNLRESCTPVVAGQRFRRCREREWKGERGVKEKRRENQGRQNKTLQTIAGGLHYRGLVTCLVKGALFNSGHTSSEESESNSFLFCVRVKDRYRREMKGFRMRKGQSTKARLAG